MFILDSLLIGSLRFVLEKIAAAADAESQNAAAALREQLLQAEMRLELGQISQAEFAEIERKLFVRIREFRGASPEPLTMTSSGAKVAGVEVSVAGDLHEDRELPPREEYRRHSQSFNRGARRARKNKKI